MNQLERAQSYRQELREVNAKIRFEISEGDVAKAYPLIERRKWLENWLGLTLPVKFGTAGFLYVKLLKPKGTPKP